MGRFFLFVLLFVTLWMIFTTVNLPKPGETEAISRQTFELINQERKQANLTPLIWDSTLERLAIAHSQYMADTGDFRHSEYDYAENIAKGATSSGKELYELWLDSPLHHANIMNRSLRYGAIGIAYKMTDISIGSFKVTIDIANGCATFMAR